MNERRLRELLAAGPRVVAVAPDHFLAANPSRHAELRGQYERFLKQARKDYRVVAELKEFGYSRDTLTILARNDAGAR